MSDLVATRLEALLDELIGFDPDAAARFIEQQLAKIELQKRLSAHKAKKAALAQQAEPVKWPEGYEVHNLPADYTGRVWIEGQVRNLYDRAALAQQAGKEGQR